jgi:hypothetical protein
LLLAAMSCEKRNLHGAPNTTVSTWSMTGTNSTSPSDIEAVHPEAEKGWKCSGGLS